MGRHSQSSSLSTTLVELGALASKSFTNTSASRGRRRAEGPAKTSISPAMYRAGGVAATLSLAVSGGAYAATQFGDSDIAPLTESQARLQAMAVTGDDVTASQVVGGDVAEVSSVTEDVTDEFERVEQETDALAEGETEVETEGVNGVTRVVYRVTSVGAEEVAREVVSRVVVSERVDEVVLVGTGTASDTSSDTSTTTTTTASGDGTTAASAQSIAQSMMSSYGWDDSQFSCLVSLWNRESGWNYQAQNASSGAYGIPQALPGSKMSSVASDWATNPTTQITWGLSYISGRYGTPCSAWAHSESTGWY
ncbi:G5 domain-containing protein [Actinomyces sp. MRS3W]|uniref:aggregation-promoting factor C-terminal-like domain-containing protein n=1 Tax=Actinomyces sp. MRS3W TaxID=2800796 RepID=UPI0028FDB460|nr:G5 domain-containing protein [Actinomyces sp. MRS3W]MDU0348263.1 G5 domain-containing protein [Actinomyces sp. MRS3W]